MSTYINPARWVYAGSGSQYNESVPADKRARQSTLSSPD